MPTTSLQGRLRIAALALATAGASLAFAQGTTIIKNPTVLVGDGTIQTSVSVTVQNGEIAGLGPPGFNPLAKSVDAEGKFLTPGLIDVWSTLGMQSGGEGRATGRAIDAYNPFDHDQIRFALERGVTTVYVPARVQQGVGGRGAVVRLLPDATVEGRVLSEENALHVVLAGPGQGPLARVRAVRDLRRAWLDAREYREALNTYEDDLKEYEEKLKKRQEQKPADSPDAQKKDEKGARPEAARGRAADPPRPDKPAEGGPGQDAKKDELKKPQKPDRDSAKELLLKVLDGELAVRIEAEYPEDILNLLDLAREQSLPLVLEGASGAGAVAAKLAEAEVPVILSAQSPPLAFVGDASQYRDAAALSRLIDAGVSVYFGSGPTPGGQPATQHLALVAAWAVSRGLPEADALPALTSRAAELLGVNKEIGRVARGLSADLVLWSHHPFDPQARVERVWIAGREVYNFQKQANP